MLRSKLLWLIFSGVGAAALVIGYYFVGRPPISPSSAARRQSEPSASTGQPATPDDEPRERSALERARFPQLPPVINATSRPAPAAAPAPARSEPTLYTRQLVSGLTNLDFSHGPITQEQADKWKQTLQALTAQGPAGVPAIREFLAKNYELNFSAINGAELLGQTSLRSALIDALAQIGGAEATAVLVQTLQTTTLPSEIALLAQHLEQMAPGQYRQETLSAVSQVLAMAGRGQLPAEWDVGTLFKVLQTYGDSTTTSVLEQFQRQWKYYATMSLAGLEGGQGVPALIRQAQDPAAGGKRDLAFQMLAQVALQYPEATSALLEQARANRIPESTWPKIATGLAGDQYLFGAPPGGLGTEDAVPPGLKTYHIANGNQNFYSLPFSADGQLTQRIALIDQLLAVTSNPAAVVALQEARATLTALVPKE